MWLGWWALSLQLRSGGGDTWEWCSWQPHQGHPGDVGEGGRDPTSSLFWALFSAVPPRWALQALTAAGGAALPLREVLLGEHPRTSSLGAEQGKHSSPGKTLSSNSLNLDSLPAVHVSHLVFTSVVAVVFLQQGRVSRCPGALPGALPAPQHPDGSFCLAASPFIIAMLLASLNSCCNPWIYMLYTGHLFHDLMRRFLCCSTRYLKSRPACDLSVSKKSNSSSFVLSCKSTSQRSFTQPAAT